jgi:hypothetical protein
MRVEFRIMSQDATDGVVPRTQRRMIYRILSNTCAEVAWDKDAIVRGRADGNYICACLGLSWGSRDYVPTYVAGIERNASNPHFTMR